MKSAPSPRPLLFILLLYASTPVVVLDVVAVVLRGERCAVLGEGDAANAAADGDVHLLDAEATGGRRGGGRHVWGRADWRREPGGRR